MDLTRRRFGVLVLAALAANAAMSQTNAREPRSIRDGVYTLEQARRGRTAYTGPCDRCHGYKLDGASEDPDMLPAPPIAGPKFLRKWSGRSLAVLVEYLRLTMPANNPGYLTDDEWVDIVAYMLAASEMPAGTRELLADASALAAVVIVPAAQ